MELGFFQGKYAWKPVEERIELTARFPSSQSLGEFGQTE